MKLCSFTSFFLLCLLSFCAKAQINMLSTDSVAAQVMLGNYNPSLYQASTILNNPVTISNGISANVSADSVHAYLDVIRTFRNHNTGSDTVSSTNGIGAARRWAYSKFQQFSTTSQNRLIPSYFQFDYTGGICGIVQHRNIFAVLPGLDTSDKSIVLVEAHLDSRCENVCDTASLAQGMEDNGSGTALVLELARVMSQYSYNHTIVFMITTGEEQGLYGAQAFATYAQQTGIAIKGVLNNDVIGGIFCGYTSSAPSCPGYGNIDSNNVRIFSLGSFNSFHKGLARFVKLEYKERILPFASVPMTINIMTPEDRTGRGGDHEPFTSLNYPSIRFTAANEDGDADVTDTAYHDRQHTTRDTLGVDTNNDGIIDSFFIDFDYLARNTVINGNAIGMMGIGPKTPDFTLASNGLNNLVINITQQQQYNTYKVGVRTTTNDWDSVYAFSGSLNYTISNLPPEVYIVSVASVDSNGIESIFSEEKMANVGIKAITTLNGSVQLLQNNPNPADEITNISVVVNNAIQYKEAYISIRDIAGKEVQRLPVQLKEGMNETAYRHGDHASGTFIYTLMVDGQAIQSKRMVFTN